MSLCDALLLPVSLGWTVLREARSEKQDTPMYLHLLVYLQEAAAEHRG